MVGSFFFIALNLVDAWLTKQAFAIGETELNPFVRFFNFGDNLLVKGFLALVITLILWRLGKSHLLWYLNLLMLTVVFWNAAVLTLLQIYC
jgi:hypothetical protein